MQIFKEGDNCPYFERKTGYNCQTCPHWKGYSNNFDEIKCTFIDFVNEADNPEKYLNQE